MVPLFSRLLCLSLIALLSLAGCQAPASRAPATALSSAPAVPPAQHSPGPYRVTLLGDGTEVELLGEISAPSIATLQAMLAAHPEVRVLQLTSPGGRRSAVSEIWPLLLARRLTTVVPLFCASACAELFLAGDRRVLAKGAVLGFHQSHMRYVGAYDAALISQVTALSNTNMAERMVERGVDPAFAQRAIATSPETFWYPTAEELRRAGVVTQVGAEGFAPPSTGTDRALLLDWSIFNSRVESAYGSAFPQDYAALRSAAWQAIRREGFGSEQPSALMAEAIAGAIAPALAISSNEAAAAYVRGLAAGLALVTKASPEDCFRFVDGNLGTVTSLDTESEERLQAYYLQLTAELFGAAGRGPRQEPPTRAEYEAAYQAMQARIRNSGLFEPDDAEIIRNPERHSARYCELAVRLMSAVLQEPEPNRGILLRSMLLYD